MVAQREERPGRRNNERLACNTVDQRVAAVPASARTHAVVQHGFGKLSASRRGGRKQFLGALIQNQNSHRRRLNPAACSRSPSPPSIRTVDGGNVTLR